MIINTVMFNYWNPVWYMDDQGDYSIWVCFQFVPTIVKWVDLIIQWLLISRFIKIEGSYLLLYCLLYRIGNALWMAVFFLKVYKLIYLMPKCHIYTHILDVILTFQGPFIPKTHVYLLTQDLILWFIWQFQNYLF